MGRLPAALMQRYLLPITKGPASHIFSGDGERCCAGYLGFGACIATHNASSHPLDRAHCAAKCCRTLPTAEIPAVCLQRLVLLQLA